MERRRGDAPTRSDVQETIDVHRTEMDERSDAVQEKVEDLEVERRTLEELERGGTADGAEEADRNIEQAQEASGGEFAEESEALEQKQGEVKEYEEELDDREGVAASDRERIVEGRNEVSSDASRNELAEAEAAAEADIEFLDENEQAARDAREQSEQLHEEHVRRAAAAKSS